MCMFNTLIQILLQAFRHAHELSSLVYKIDRTVSLGDHFYIFDIDCSRDGSLCFSAVNSIAKSHSRKPVLFMSPSGRYIALEEEDGINFIYGTKTSVVIQSANRKVNYIDYAANMLMFPMSPLLKSLTDGKGSIRFQEEKGYTPRGITTSKTGGILICLWNNKIGDRSFGKVVRTNNSFEIFTDKNNPLYICPTYIAENGNRDICVSDVKAVVVTDAGGMLRFRYQGNSNDSNFDPYGICCDSSCNIIVSDMKNDRIRVIDKDGSFLYDITYEGIKKPRALCIDKNDHVYVGEWESDIIKVILR